MKKFLLSFAQILFALLVLASSVLVAAWTFDYTKMMLGGEDWITAPATITYTYGVLQSGSRTGGTINIFANTEYTFVAKDGKAYSDSDYGVSAGGATEEEVDQGKVIVGEIYYDPENPNDSALERPLFIPVFTLVLAAIAAFLSWVGYMALEDVITRMRPKK